VTQEKQIKKIKQNGLQRRLAVTVAGAQGGVRLLKSHAGSIFMAAEDKKQLRQKSLAQEAARFTYKLGELKGAYVKIGQMMALYGEHILPQEITAALHQLEHQTNSMEWPVIEAAIKKGLGKKYKDLDIESMPLAAASLAQVHQATKKTDDRALCIKVQYPGVANTIQSDFNSVLQMLRLTRWVQSGRDFEDWTQEIKDMLLDEVDYQREMRMTQKVAQLLASDSRYLVPEVAENYSTKTLLTMTYLDGVEVTHPSVARLSQSRRNNLARAMLEIFFKEVFEWGIMQTDPNFGNYRVQFRNEKDDIDKLVLLDFGAVRELSKDFTAALRKTILAAHKQDRQELIEGAIELKCLRSNQTNAVKESFADFCILLMEPFRKDMNGVPDYALNKQQHYKWQESRLLKRVGKLGAKSIAIDGFSSPPKEFALIARKLTGVFTFVSTLEAELKVNDIVEQYLD